MDEIIQGYTVERVLMKKGLRLTALARETASGRNVVVKVIILPPGEAAANAARARFRHLVEKIQKLSGGEFVHILSWGEENGKLYLVREHEEGMTLAEVLSAVKRLPVELAALLFREIVRAVTKAHTQDIAHLDLTQANIVFRQDGKLVFTDWVKEEEGVPSSPAAEGVQWFWQKADQNLDLFSMGILFAKVLVGEPKLGPEAAEAEIVVDLSQRLRGDPSISERMTKIIQKLLGEEFERYGGSEEVLKELEDYIQQLGEFDPQVAWQRFLDGPGAFVEQLNQWKAKQISKGAKELLEKGKVQEAKADFERALAVDPNCTEAETELELLSAKEGLSVEKLVVPSVKGGPEMEESAVPPLTPPAKPALAELFAKLRSSEPLPMAATPTVTKVPEPPALEVPKEEVQVPQPIESSVPGESLFAKIEQSSAEAEIPPPGVSMEFEEVSEKTEMFAPPEEPAVISEMAEKVTPEISAVPLMAEALAPVVLEPEIPKTEEVSIPIFEAPMVETVSLTPAPEKLGEGDEKVGIGFEEAVTKLPVAETPASPEEGRGALEVPQRIGAEEFAALGRRKSIFPWKIFGFIGMGLVVVVAVLFLARLFNKPKEKEKDSEALYQEALRAQEVGDFERALSKFDQVARLYSQSPKARLALSGAADLEWRLGSTDKALGHYQMVASGNADDSLGREARFHRALILREKKKPAEALSELSGFIIDSTAAKRTIEAKMIAAQLLHEQGMADSALAVYGVALNMDREMTYAVQMHKERGLIYEEKEDWKAARAEYDAILAMTQPSDLSHVWAEQKASAMAVKLMGKGR